MSFLAIQALSKSYGDSHIVADIDLELAQQQTLSILGKSGCGKTTMLKMIAGLVPPDQGRICVDGEDVSTLSPQLRNIVYLYQEDLLFPHFDVYDNIAFGLKVRKVATPDIRRQVLTMLNHLELSEHIHKMPHQLSGGQRQRVSFGRAIIISPRLLLLDEPFGSLDAGTRATMQDLFRRLTAEYQTTSLFVTHDLKEALQIGDQIAYMADGHLTVYPSTDAFVKDAGTGVQAELDFWQALSNKHRYS